MRVAVIANSKAAGVSAALDGVCRALQELGAELLFPAVSGEFPAADTDEVLLQSDVAVALGGDGTIIHTAKRAANCGRAVLGDQLRPPGIYGGIGTG